MEAVEQETLLAIVHFAAVVAGDGVEACVEAAEGLVAFLQDIVAKAVGAAAVVFCAGIVEGGVVSAVYVHFGLAFYPAGVVAVHAGGKTQACKVPLALDAVCHGVGPAFLYRVLLAVKGVEVPGALGDFPFPALDHVVEGLGIFAAVFHGDAAVLAEGHFPIGIKAAARRNKDGGGI